MYHLMAPHPCPKLTDQIVICGGYDKSWKVKTDHCEIIDEDGHDKNIYKTMMSLQPFVDKSSYWDATKSFYRGKPSYLTLTDQGEFNRATIITGGDSASGIDDFADVWLIVTNPKDKVGGVSPAYGPTVIRQVGAYKIGNVNKFKKEIGKWEQPSSSKVIRRENFRYDQFIEYNEKIFFHSPGIKNVVEFRRGS